MKMKKLIAGIMCAVMLLGTATMTPMNAKACGRLYTVTQNSQQLLTACGGTDSAYVIQSATSFYACVKGSNCAYITKSGNVTGITWCGYQNIKGSKYGVYKISFKKTKAPNSIGSVTFANGNKRVTLKLYAAGTLNF